MTGRALAWEGRTLPGDVERPNDAEGDVGRLAFDAVGFAVDLEAASVGVRDGRIVALGEDLGPGPPPRERGPTGGAGARHIVAPICQGTNSASP